MTEARYRMQVESDHLAKLAGARPVHAISELVWNALDADATRVDVQVEGDDLGLNAIIVSDNGSGFSHADAEQLFSRVGGSWKRHGARSKLRGRMLHGKEGKGRLKALALGRVADWIVRYQDGGKLLQYQVTLIRDQLVNVVITAPVEISSEVGAGVEVRVTELDLSQRALSQEAAVRALSEIFAIYLTDYPDVSIFFEHERLDPSTMILDRKMINLAPINDGKNDHPAQVVVIEWRSSGERSFFLCGHEGFPFLRMSPKFKTPGHPFSGYLRSSFIDALQAQGTLELAELNPSLEESVDAAGELIKAHFKSKDAAVAQSEIARWKADDIYPYPDDPTTSVEQAERKVFDIVALSLNRHLPDFSEQSRRTRAFQLRMLRQAVEKGPEDLQHIFTEVLGLSAREQQEMSKLLKEASLANVISASRLVADRLKFIHGLETVLFETESRNLLKERSQLHRMIADNNTWIFGEEFNLTVDDQSLTAVLLKHQQLIGVETVIDKPVKRLSGKAGIVDLMLSRSVPSSRGDEREHLVVELKRPKVDIGSKEITQVEEYAFAIAADERFKHLKTRWVFCVISNDLTDFAARRARQKDKPRGLVHQSDDGMVEVWVKTWSEVIAECKARLRFVQEHLQTNVDRDNALAYLKKTYNKYLCGIAEGPAESANESAGHGAVE